MKLREAERNERRVQQRWEKVRADRSEAQDTRTAREREAMRAVILAARFWEDGNCDARHAIARIREILA